MSKNSSYPSKAFLTLQIPEPEDVQGKFEYRYFTIDENINDNDSHPFVSDVFLERYGPPRRVVLNFRSISTLAADNVLGQLFNNAGKSLIFNDNFGQKLTSEVLLQSSGFVKYTSFIKDPQRYILDDSAGESVTAQDAFFTMAGSLDNDFMNILKDQAAKQKTFFINPTTGLPTVAGADTVPDRAMENMISSEFIYDVVNTSANDPYSYFSLDQQLEKPSLKSLQANSRKINNPLASGLEDYEFVAPTIPDGLDGAPITGVAIVGLIIFKNEIVNGEKKPMSPILVSNSSATTVIDTKIKYDSEYEYNVHTLCVLRTEPDVNILLVGTSAKTLRIDCVEKKPPPPIQAVHFHWTGRNVKLRWQMPVQTNDLGGPIGDIKGYQVFYRHSIEEPFRILKYIDFNDLIQELTPLENIPDQFKITTELPLNTIEAKIVPDKPYIFAVCTVDAHGNSSNLSTQYEVTLVSRDNSLKIDFVSYPGAPKQYPNFMMSKKLFVDSMAVSNVNKLKIYYKPDATDLTIYKTESKIAVESAQDADGDIMPAYRVQMIDVNSQNDNILDINVKKISSGR